MILPLKEFPTAPAQGALAIECRSDDADTRNELAKLHCPATAHDVARERQLLEDWGGGWSPAVRRDRIKLQQPGFNVVYTRQKTR